jgi:hypothetical protein
MFGALQDTELQGSPSFPVILEKGFCEDTSHSGRGGSPGTPLSPGRGETQLQEIERNTKQGGWKRLLHLFPKRRIVL